jgi:hypothetical protein
VTAARPELDGELPLHLDSDGATEAHHRVRLDILVHVPDHDAQHGYSVEPDRFRGEAASVEAVRGE